MIPEQKNELKEKKKKLPKVNEVLDLDKLGKEVTDEKKKNKGKRKQA